MRLFFPYLLVLLPLSPVAQEIEFPMEPLPLNDLSAFRPAGANWQIVGNATADLAKEDALRTSPGVGVLVNLPDTENRSNLLFAFEHGDIDLELEVMMARHSNSGIYLQGRYEIQLFDSWGKKRPTFGDIGGVYERWNNNMPEGQKGFQGIPPLVNVARAPGLWQQLRIEFRAPRFDASGNKIANARLIRVLLNGVAVQENVELTGPTRGQAFSGEAPLGPILIQGDHGPVAFRNIRYRRFDEAHPVTLSGLTYRYFSGAHDYLPNFPLLKSDAGGNAEGLSWEYAKGDNDFALQFTGTLQVPEAGKYAFTLHSFGNSMLKINGDTLIGQGWWNRIKATDLPAGDVPIEVTYCKAAEWQTPGLALFVEGPHTRPAPLHLPGSFAASNPVSPIFLQPGKEPELLRSFIDIPQGDGRKRKRIVHAISVGYPDDLSYTFDLDCGALVQVWKGGFLDATPMWHDRGDGHAEPLGSVLLLGDMPQLAVPNDSWPDTFSTSDGFRLIGYQLDAGGNPSYHYSVFGMAVSDRLMPRQEGKWLDRELVFQGNIPPGLLFRAAAGKNIVQVSPDTWAVDDQRYYIRLDGDLKPQIRQSADAAEMLFPVNTFIQYSLIW